MTTHHQIHVRFIPANDFKPIEVGYSVDAFVAQDHGWGPYDLCRDAMTAMIADGVTRLGAARIDADREKLAKDIANGLTNAIMKALKSRDLENGYRKETQV